MEPEQPALACTVPAAKGRLPDHSPDRRPSAADRLPLYGREPSLRICFRKTDSFAAGMQRREDRCNLRSPIWDSNPYLRIGSPLSWPVGRIGRRYERGAGLSGQDAAPAVSQPIGKPWLPASENVLQDFRQDSQIDLTACREMTSKRIALMTTVMPLSFLSIRSGLRPDLLSFLFLLQNGRVPVHAPDGPGNPAAPVSFCMLVFLPFRGRL